MQHSPRPPVYTQPPQQPETPSPDMRAVCNRAGVHATACVAAFIAKNHTDVVQESAAFMLELESIWQALALEPEEVWTELLRRIEMGELFLRLNQPPHRKKMNGRTQRPWRISTSKLP
ncbi:phosphoribosyl-ATP pyrophosphatase [Acetobacter orientalis]|uniref:phosphoribosyl-ATP pyrophosphatase n=1 Tax=Acetobacter orientalis TaxID=146474 RepID=UPI0039E89FEF